MILSKLEDNYELQANLFSFVIHFGLFIFMLVTIQWQMKDVYYSEIELWDTMPMQIKPQPIFKEEPVESKQPTPKPIEPQEIVKSNDEADIQLKKKKEAEKKETEKKAQIKLLKEQALKQEKIEQIQKKLLEQEKIEQIQKKLLEQEKIDQLKQSVLDQEVSEKARVAIEGDRDIVSGSNTGELDKFKAMIQQKIYQNVNKQLCGLDPVELVFEIQLMPTGELLGEPKILKSSKIESCDEALGRAILQSQPLPVPKDAHLFSKLKKLKLMFQPNAYAE